MYLEITAVFQFKANPRDDYGGNEPITLTKRIDTGANIEDVYKEMGATAEKLHQSRRRGTVKVEPEGPKIKTEAEDVNTSQEGEESPEPTPTPKKDPPF